MTEHRCIVLFDGECNLCNRAVTFILKRDRRKIFSFASLQSPIGEELLSTYRVDPSVDSIVFIVDEMVYIKSTAALHIARRLDRPWPIFASLLVIPTRVRDIVYTFIANNRINWFGKKNVCRIPTPEERKRFLDQ